MTVMKQSSARHQERCCNRSEVALVLFLGLGDKDSGRDLDRLPLFERSSSKDTEAAPGIWNAKRVGMSIKRLDFVSETVTATLQAVSR